MTTRANKALLHHYKVAILNNRDLDALDQVAAPGYLDHAAFPGELVRSEPECPVVGHNRNSTQKRAPAPAI
jgi:hypothetical protein